MIGFLRNLFGRTPPPLRDMREWNEDWQGGDLARCICSDWPNCKPHPIEGRVYRVRSIGEGTPKNISQNVILVGLGLEGLPCKWHCTGFRKVRPSIEAADEEFTAELRDRLGVPA